jgi:hypothetical protein
MSLRFQKHISLFPGVRLNLSRSGMSVSIGIPGASINFGGKAGTSMTLGLPGTGISYRHHFDTATPDAETHSVLPSPATPIPDSEHKRLGTEIKSAAISALTTPDLEGLKRLLNEAANQRHYINKSVCQALDNRNKAWYALERSRKLPLKIFSSIRSPKLKANFDQAKIQLEKEVEKLNACHVQVDFAFDAETLEAYASLAKAHIALKRSQMAWDITSSTIADRMRTRSVASNSVTRLRITLSDAKSAIVASKWAGMRFENANGSDIELFPGFCLMRKSLTDYALIDLRDIDLQFIEERFIEENELPNDAQIIDYAWEKSNKDGSRDQRFIHNRRFPIMGYGRLEFRSKQGLNEAFMFSNRESARQFAAAFLVLQNSLKRMATNKTDNSDLMELDRGINSSPLYIIPELPSVKGAHEYTLASFVISVSLIWLNNAMHTLQPTPPIQSQHPEATYHTHEKSTDSAAVNSATTYHDAMNTPSKLDLLDQVITLKHANLREGPSTSTAVLKTIAPGTTFQVFGRNAGWIQVGNSKPLGWISKSLIRHLPIKD